MKRFFSLLLFGYVGLGIYGAVLALALLFAYRRKGFRDWILSPGIAKYHLGFSVAVLGMPLLFFISFKTCDYYSWNVGSDAIWYFVGFMAERVPGLNNDHLRDQPILRACLAADIVIICASIMISSLLCRDAAKELLTSGAKKYGIEVTIVIALLLLIYFTFSYYLGLSDFEPISLRPRSLIVANLPPLLIETAVAALLTFAIHLVPSSFLIMFAYVKRTEDGRVVSEFD